MNSDKYEESGVEEHDTLSYLTFTCLFSTSIRYFESTSSLIRRSYTLAFSLPGVRASAKTASG